MPAKHQGGLGWSCLNPWAPYLFWDYMSLAQMLRTEEEESGFRVALASMHLLYIPVQQ